MLPLTDRVDSVFGLHYRGNGSLILAYQQAYPVVPQCERLRH